MAWEFAPGEILTATNLNAVTIPWNAICVLRMSAPQSVSNNSVTALSFATEDLDPRGWHAGGSPTLVTPTIAGWYEVSVYAAIQSDTDTTRVLIEIQKNAGSLSPICSLDLAAADGADFVPRGYTLSTPPFEMNGSSDTIRAVAFQTNTSAGANTFDAVMSVKLVYPS